MAARKTGRVELLWDYAWLREKYEGEKLSMQAIADVIGCSLAGVFTAFKRGGIVSRHDCGATKLEPKPCAYCGDLFVPRPNKKDDKQGCCSMSCARLLPLKHLDASLRNRDWLRQKYVVEKLSSREIAAILGCSDYAVWTWLTNFEIESRSHSEAKKILFDKRGRKYVSQQELIDAYDGVCACCGETETAFLTLDHIGGGGRKHRKTYAGKNAALEIRKELKAQGWPKDKYRLLCMNCNFATRHGRTCPHQLKKQFGETQS
jgi:hypothetical protein